MKDREKQKAYDNANIRTVAGYRVIYSWTYIDPLLGDFVTVPANAFVTQPFPRGEFRCHLFGTRELYIPRAILRRARTTCKKQVQDDILLGKLAPKKFWDAPECVQQTGKI